MPSFLEKSILIAAALGLSACGGGTGGTTQFVDPLEALENLGDLNATDDADAVLDTIARRGNEYTALIASNANPTPATTIQTTGSATFTGVAAVNSGTTTDAINLLGDAEIVVNFANDEFTGTLDAFFGTEGDRLDLYTGQIDVTDGVVGPNGPRANIGARYSGTLTGNGSTLAFDGIIFGNLQNDPLSATQLSSNPNAGSFDEAVVNGTRRPMLLGITAECTVGCP